MKRFLFNMLWMLFFIPCYVNAATCTLAWDYTTPTPIEVTGFHVYQSRTSGVYTVPVAVTIAPSARSVAIPCADNDFFVMTAFSSTRESAHSNEVRVAPAPSVPANLTIKTVVDVTVTVTP